jgi:hypothetical protein
VHGAFSGNQLVSVLGAPGTASRTLFANVRFESLATDQVVAGQYGLDPEGRESGVELLVAGLMGSLAGLCELPTGKLAGRLVVRVTASGNDYLFTCTDKCAPPSGSWTLVAAEVGPAGISIFSGFDKAKNVVQCGGPPVPGPLALFEGLATVTVGGRLGPDGKVIQGLHGRITDLVVASGALPSSAPYSPMNLLCLHLQELDCSPTPPPGALVVLRFLSDSHGLIEEAGHLQVLNGLQDGPDTADVLLESGPETFRGHCPVPRNP